MPATGPAPHSGPGYQCELPRTMPGLLRWAAHLSWTPSRLEDRGWRGLGATCHLQALPCMPTDPRPPSPADPGKSWTLFPPRTSSLQTGEERAAAQAQVQGEGVGQGGAGRGPGSGRGLSPASLLSRDWSSSDTFRNTSSRVVSISPKLLRCRASKLRSRCCGRAGEARTPWATGPEHHPSAGPASRYLEETLEGPLSGGLTGQDVGEFGARV